MFNTKTQYTMSSYQYDDSEGHGWNETSEINIQKTFVDEDVSDLSEMFLSFLQANGFTWAKGVSIITDTGEEHQTDDYGSYTNDAVDTSWDVDYGEQPHFNFDSITESDVNLEITPDIANVEVKGYSTESIWSQPPAYASVNVRTSINDATPSEWDDVARKMSDSVNNTK
jgi:hypothetical protein